MTVTREADRYGVTNISVPGPSQRESASRSVDLAERTLYRRAVEATIWGMPAVSMASIRASLKRDLGADFGDVVYFSDLLAPRHEFLLADHDTPYVLTFFDLRRGAMVLDVPPAAERAVFFGGAVDSWAVPLVQVGAAGEDAGQGGRYLFLPPGFHGKHPAGYLVVPSPTVFVHVALRPITIGNGTIEDAVAYSRRLKAYSLGAAAKPPLNRYVDAFPRVWRTLPKFDLNYLRLLAEVIEADPPQARDAAMLGMLASIGIEKGKPFRPDVARAAVLRKAVQEGHAYIAETSSIAGFERPYWPDRQWLATQETNTYGSSFFGNGKLDYDRRATSFALCSPWAPKRLKDPGERPVFYHLKGFRDKSGDLFRGNVLYRLRVPPDTPAHDYWSIIAYESGTNAFIHNPYERVGVSSYDKHKLMQNEDGSIDVYLGPRPPKGLEANWIPTAGRDFWLMARFCGPDKPLLDRSWVMPDVEKAI